MKYYLPIDSKCLAHYYASACISPSCYIANRPQDIQDQFNEYLLLTNKLGTKEANCCLEIVLTANEQQSLVDMNRGWFVYESPIPISRISGILFSSKDQMDTTLTNIRMSTAFIPDNLSKVVAFDDNPARGLKLPNGIVPTPHNENIKKFDRILGALALMNVSREHYMNYSDRFFETFSMFNEYIARQLKSVKKKLSQPLSVYLDYSNQYRKKIQQLEQPLTEDIVISVAQQEKVNIEKNKITKVINLSSLTGWSYIFAFIYQYGVGSESKRKKIDSLIISNFKSSELLKSPSPDTLALLYGYNRGYSVFSNAYGLDADNKLAIKFKMESRLDHYIIESIYQYVFNNKVADTPFDYIDSWCPNIKNTQDINSTDYQILDTVIIGKKKAKVFSAEYWNGFFQELKSDFWYHLKGLVGKEQVESNIKEFVNIIRTDLFEEWTEQNKMEKDRFLEELAEQKQKIDTLKAQVLLLQEQLNNNPPSLFDAEKSTNPIKEESSNSELFINELLLTYDKYQKMLVSDLKNKLAEQSVLYDKNAKKDELAKLLVKVQYKQSK